MKSFLNNHYKIIILILLALIVTGFIAFNYIFKSDYKGEVTHVSAEQALVSSDDGVEIEEMVLTKEDNLRSLRDKLRNASLGGVRRSEPMRVCDDSIGVIVEDGEEKIVEVGVKHGLTFTFNLADGTNDNDALEIHATDSEGGVAGNFPYTNHEDVKVSNVWRVRGYGHLNILMLDEYVDGAIRIRNIDSKPHMFSFYISDLLGNCDLTSQIMFGVSTSSTVTIPLSKAGDIGPMEWDFESDGVVDMYESLVFELSEEQIRLRQDIFVLTHPDEVLEQCNGLSEWTYPQEDQYLYRDVIIMKEWCLDKGL